MSVNRWWQALLALAIVAAAVGVFRFRASAHAQTRPSANAAAERPLPVIVATVQTRDVPVYLEGLGTVTGFYTVTVHSQVDGRLDRVMFEEGQTVHRGDVIAQIDPRPFEIQLHQAEATLARDEAALRLNQRILERDRVLRARNFVAPQDYDTALGNVEQLQGTVRADRAVIETARLNLDYARPRAPFDGVTGIRQVDPGNLVHPTDANGLVVITQIDPIAVLFTLPQDDLPRIQQQLALGPLNVDVFTRDGTTPLGAGHLALVDNQIVGTTASIRLKAILPNPGRALWPQQFVKARLLLETRRGALVVPASAIQRGPQGSFVYIVGENHRVAVRVVAVDRIEGELVLIASGLVAGETVISDGQGRLGPGALVAPRPAAGPAATTPGGTAAQPAHGAPREGGHGARP